MFGKYPEYSLANSEVNRLFNLSLSKMAENSSEFNHVGLNRYFASFIEIDWKRSEIIVIHW